MSEPNIKDGKENKDSKELKDRELKERETGGGPGRRKTVRKGMFAKDLKLLMYGFGD
ncbi:unnamed protein product [Cunninghamella blakesleeana]